MATAYRLPYLTIGGLNCGTMAIDCYDWSALWASPPKRGSNRVLPGIAGQEVRPRVRDQLRAPLAFRLRGDYNDVNAHVGGNETTWHTNIYDRLATLRNVCDLTTPQTMLIYLPGRTISTTCQIEEMGPASFDVPWIAHLVVDVTLPTGPVI